MKMQNIFAFICALFLMISFYIPCRSQASNDESQDVQEIYKLPKPGRVHVRQQSNDSRSIQKNMNDDSDNSALENVQQNYEKVRERFKKAAMQGNSDAQFNLGQMYMDGTAGTINYHEAAQWFEKAAVNGNFNAQYKLGKMYINGQGVNQDYKKAVEWIEKAALQGDVYAQYSIALMIENGIGVKADNEKALTWYASANSLMGKGATIDIESLANKLEKTEVDRAMSNAEEISSNMRNVRDVYSSEDVFTTAHDFMDILYEKLPTGHLAYIYPKKISINEIQKVQLIISVNKIELDLKGSEKKNEIMESMDKIKICNRMGAKLSGIAFKIGKIGNSKIQNVSSNQETNWMWELDPITEGNQTLYLVRSVVFLVLGKDMLKDEKAIQINIDVKDLPILLRIWRYIEKNFLWAITTGVIIAIITFMIPIAYKKYRKEKK